jgi:anionic cell wall polymer biosynthesis LytR-Cps2A-Psr (LCP) family protein
MGDFRPRLFGPLAAVRRLGVSGPVDARRLEGSPTMPNRSRLALLIAMLMVVSFGPAVATGGDRSGRRPAADPVAAITEGVIGLLVRTIGPAGGSSIQPGSDGRLTVLLLGSDRRPGLAGERFDTIMVASLRLSTGKITAASIPRDTVYFPRANGGTSGATRVNLMFETYKSASCSRTCAINRFRNDVAHALDVQIDYWAVVDFRGFDALIDQVDGIRVNTPGVIRDTIYQDEIHPPYGIYFPDANGWALRGLDTQYCKSWHSYDPCHRAIVYVRSRKGTEGSRNNNDYRRALRQQGVVMAAIRKAIKRGNGAALESLRQSSMTYMQTNMPRTWADALYLYDKLDNASLGKSTVFAPGKWGYRLGNEPVGAYRLRLGAVREWIDTRMSPAGP